MTKFKSYLCLLIFCLSSAHANNKPQGFEQRQLLPQAPNSVKGVLNNARVGDFALLRGHFVTTAPTLILEDEEGSQAKICPAEPLQGLKLREDASYTLWLLRSDEKNCPLVLMRISPPYAAAATAVKKP